MVHIYIIGIICYNKVYAIFIREDNMMKKGQRILAILLITIVSSLLLVKSSHVTACESSNVNIPSADYQEECTFSDSNELTTKEKCEELAVKALTDEKNLLDDGIITKEVYKLQCQPFEKILDDLQSASNEKIFETYKQLLLYYFDELSEYKAYGEEIDEEFWNYIMEEIDTLERNGEIIL